MILEAVHRSPGICLKAEENPGKPQLGDRLMKGLRDQTLPQMGHFPPNEVSKIAQHVRKGEGRKEESHLCHCYYHLSTTLLEKYPTFFFFVKT